MVKNFFEWWVIAVAVLTLVMGIAGRYRRINPHVRDKRLRMSNQWHRRELPRHVKAQNRRW